MQRPRMTGVLDRIRDRNTQKVVAVVAIVLLITIAAAAFFFTDVRDDLTTNVQHEHRATATGDAVQLGEWIENQERMTHMLSEYHVFAYGTGVTIESAMNSELDRLPEETHAVHYVNFETRTIEHSTDDDAVGTNLESLGLEVHLREEGAIEEVDVGDVSRFDFDTTFSEPYVRDGETVIAFLSPIEGDYTGIGVMMIEASIDERAELFTDPHDGGYTLVVDSDSGGIVFAADEEFVFETYRDGTDSDVLHAAFETDVGAIEYEDTDELAAYTVVPGTDWVLVSHAPRSSAYAVADSVATSLVAIIAISFVGFLLVGATIGRTTARSIAMKLEQEAEAFGPVVSAAAAGDLTQRLDEDVENDALGTIALEFNAMLDELEETMLDVKRLAGDVDRIGEDVTRRVGEIERASGQVSRSSDEISAATAAQSERFNVVLGEMNDLSATVEEIASTADNAAARSEWTADRAADAENATNEILAEMDAMERQTSEITEGIERLNREMAEIGKVVELIDGIAEQTNLLALNASIEAASAGEAGDGFAVVANEVKTLAEETSQATTEVDELIGGVRGSVEEAVDEIETMGKQVDRGSDVVESGLEAIGEITAGVEETNEGMQSINGATDDQARASQQVVAMVEDATEHSERTTEETESVAAAVETQTASITEVSEGTASLAERAARLKRSLDSFEVDETREGGSNQPTDAVGRTANRRSAAEGADSPTVDEPSEPAFAATD